MDKLCTKCNISKDSSHFYKYTRGTDGLQAHCKSCMDKANKANQQKVENKEKSRINGRKRYAIETATYKLKRMAEMEKTKEQRLLKLKQWEANYYKYYRKKNKHKYAMYASNRKTAKLQRSPKWLTREHLLEIEGFYLLAAALTEETSGKYVVDHIIPLQGKYVSGLHVPWNLQILTSNENSVKLNIWSL